MYTITIASKTQFSNSGRTYLEMVTRLRQFSVPGVLQAELFGFPNSGLGSRKQCRSWPDSWFGLNLHGKSQQEQTSWNSVRWLFIQTASLMQRTDTSQTYWKKSGITATFPTLACSDTKTTPRLLSPSLDLQHIPHPCIPVIHQLNYYLVTSAWLGSSFPPEYNWSNPCFINWITV